MWHRVQVVLTDVSEERIASIFRVEGKIRKSVREASVRDVKSSLLKSYMKTHVRLKSLHSQWHSKQESKDTNWNKRNVKKDDMRKRTDKWKYHSLYSNY
jgi:hypothetical protein